MSILSNKKVLCFIALPHHNRFLLPIMDALQEHGMNVVYFTAAAEGAFEITLNQAKLAYRHVLDYCDKETADRIGGAYRQLRPIYQEKILANRTFQAVPVVIQDKTIRPAVENFYCINRMLEMEKPDLLFALHELNPWGKMLGYLSHVHHIPYFTLQEGLYYADLHYYRFHTDFSTACLVWGEDCRQILRNAGCSDDKIYPVGNTHIWSAKAAATSPKVVVETRAALGVAPGKKIVLFLMSHSHYQPFEARGFLDWMKRRDDVIAVFKWHPVTSNEIIERALERMPKDAPVINAPDFDTYRLIGASDICVTVGNSTTGLESIAFDKPLIECRLPDQTYSFVEQGVAESATGFEDLGEKCDAIIHRGLSERRRQQVERYLAHNFTYQDNQTLERIVDLVSESLSARINARQLAASFSPSIEAAFTCSVILPVDDEDSFALAVTLTSVAENISEDLFEVVIIDCSTRQETKELLSALNGDVTILDGEPGWSYAYACNLGAREARGKYLAFLKPGLIVEEGWLEGLRETAEKEVDVGAVGGVTLNENGLIWHIGIAFDVNQAPFSIYRLLPLEFSGARRRRDFKALEVPFLTRRELFCRLGGFSVEFSNRFEDVDFCLRMRRETGLRLTYNPTSIVKRRHVTWRAIDDHEQWNRIRFFSKWTGYLWQDDEFYLQEDGLTHDALSAMYRELAGRIAYGAQLAANSLTTNL